jgi:hypothetical protein
MAGDILDRVGTTSSGVGGGAGSSEAAQYEPYGLLPRQHDEEPALWSLARFTQAVEVMGAGLNALMPPGVLTGGEITAGSGLQVILADDTRIWVAGLIFRLNGALEINDLADDDTNYLWATILRTSAPKTNRFALDQYALSVVVDDVKPGTNYFPLAEVVTDTGAIDTISEPSGKYASKRTVEKIMTMALSSSGSGSVDHSADFLRFMVGHTAMVYVDQDNVTVEIDPHSVTSEGFDFNWTTTGAPGTNEHGTNTEVRMLFDCYGHVFDL